MTAASAPALTALLAEARTAYAALSPQDRAAHDAAQRASFARGITARCEHGVLDFEQCPQCRRVFL